MPVCLFTGLFCFLEKLQLRFQKKCNLQRRKELCIVRSCKNLRATLISNCKICYTWVWIHPLHLSHKYTVNKCMVYTQHPQRMYKMTYREKIFRLKRCIEPHACLSPISKCFPLFFQPHIYNLMRHGYCKTNTYYPRETVDSNLPVSPLEALETLVLQRHVSACQTQSR